MSDRYQEREDFGVYPLVDALLAALKERPNFQLTSEEVVAKAESHAVLNAFLALENARKEEVDQLAFAAFSGSKFKEWLLLRKIKKLDREIHVIEARIAEIEHKPAMQRILQFGRACLEKNPHLVEQYNRTKARASQNYQIQLIRGTR